MASNEFPVLDGIAPSWADISVTLSGTGIALFEMADIKEISSGTTLEVGEQRAGGRVIRTTTGSESSEASITLYRAGFQKFCEAAIAAAPRRGNEARLSLVHFDIIVQHDVPGNPTIFTYKILGCRYAGRTLNGAEGVDADTVQVPLKVKKIVDVIGGLDVVCL